MGATILNRSKVPTAKLKVMKTLARMTPIRPATQVSYLPVSLVCSLYLIIFCVRVRAPHIEHAKMVSLISDQVTSLKLLYAVFVVLVVAFI